MTKSMSWLWSPPGSWSALIKKPRFRMGSGVEGLSELRLKPQRRSVLAGRSGAELGHRIEDRVILQGRIADVAGV